MLLKVIVKKFNELMLKQCCNDIIYNYKIINKEQKLKLTNQNYFKQFKRKTNFSKTVIVVQNIKVIYFNNTQFY